MYQAAYLHCVKTEPNAEGQALSGTPRDRHSCSLVYRKRRGTGTLVPFTENAEGQALLFRETGTLVQGQALSGYAEGQAFNKGQAFNN
jgi:hypothetical protein